jgi:hypothetical protein
MLILQDSGTPVAERSCMALFRNAETVMRDRCGPTTQLRQLSAV